jgi:hypothetical protein
MNYSNSFDILLQEDDKSDIPLEKQLRNKKKRLREIKVLKSKPYEQLPPEQKRKIDTEQDIEDEIEYIKSCINNQNNQNEPQVNSPVSEKKNTNSEKKNINKKKKKKINPTKKKKNVMTEEQRDAYNKHKDKIKRKRLEKRRRIDEARRKIEEERRKIEETLRKIEEERRKIEEEAYWRQQQQQKYMSEGSAIKNALDLFGFQNRSNMTETQITKIHRKLSLKYHPDKGGDIEMMQKVNNAKELLMTICNY